MNGFTAELLKWWKTNKRNFPWRSERNAYRILIAEILLHRTRAENVVPVYLDFIRKFPDIRALSNASINDILSVTSSLGLRWRSRMIKEAAEQIVKKFNGVVPLDREKLLTLPGIGDYVASAVIVFAGAKEGILLDTNTVRVICRINGWKYEDSIRRKKVTKDRYSELRGSEGSKEFAYSLIDLASTVCTPKKPKCDICPVSAHCTTGISRFSAAIIRGHHRKKDPSLVSLSLSDRYSPPD